jgi:anaerobic dimethyl sulfoxide reductase subunit B (iron-sulfur subunit)
VNAPARPAFLVDTTVCSGCKACQIACKDRHDLPNGRLYRRVYELAGGNWHPEDGAWRPDIFAWNLSISCNHCQDPICVECCPTLAMRQRDDGIVLLNEKICIGCGYCSWACPYGSPQLRSDTGAMSKCDFCVEDLEVGQPPACVAACPVRALDCVDLKAEDPGPPAMEPLPDAGLTRPALVLEVHDDAGRSRGREYDLDPRPVEGLREWSLVCFTLLLQIAAGLSLFLLAAPNAAGQSLVPALTLLAIVASFQHLGRKEVASGALVNLRSSWLSREILLTVVFLVLGLWASTPFGGLAGKVLLAASGLFLIYGMARVYMLRTVPVWNRWTTPAGFLATALVLGGLLALALRFPVLWVLFAAALVVETVRRSRFYGSYRRLGV